MSVPEGTLAEIVAGFTALGQPALQAVGLSCYFSGMAVAAGTGTAVTLFCGEPSISRSE